MGQASPSAPPATNQSAPTQYTPAQCIPVLQEALTAARESIRRQFAAGEAAGKLIADYAGFMDGVMALAWDSFTWREERSAWFGFRKNQPISLLAVGGYGRRELLPHSDIDLLILLERDQYDHHKAKIQKFLALLWDLGLEVGHSVRSLGECRRQAGQDVTVLTAMMESRTLAGDAGLREKMHGYIAPEKIWSSTAFFQAKRDEQAERHAKSDHTEYSLQPNVKTSPGGLRDIQVLMWIAKRQYGIDGFADDSLDSDSLDSDSLDNDSPAANSFAKLVTEKVLTTDEANDLTKGRSFLWKIRFALHCLAGRDENRLTFDHQRELAAQFGYQDGHQLAVEQFMQDYYRTAHRINTINDITLQYFDEAIVRAGERLTSTPINERFQLLNNYIEVRADDVFQRSPSALLEMFVLVANDDKIKGIRASTIRLARQCVHLIDDGFRQDPANAELFMQLLDGDHHLFTQLKRMGRYGILGAYLPEFGRVIGQMQFDLFHIYTVDAHSLQVVRNMRRFRYRNNQQQFPIAAQIHARLPRVELLYIAGLYHDLAKGMGGDHSELGVGLAKGFCERHGLADWETSLVCWLVLNHLAMSSTAQRKDIQDPEVVHEFALLVGDQMRLDYLYALTVADINATNQTLWNGWRASL
ncbi:MAG: bifunctional uridylyltransferase/uridylyl-removing protein GlnD, partial [Pseudomonadales bacterium]